MIVAHVLNVARRRLVTVSQEAPISDAAEILANPKTPLVVVCDREGIAVGVISRTDVVKALASARASALTMSAETLMTRNLLSVGAHQSLQEVWDLMNARSVRCVPILDDDGRAQGILHARDLASALLEDAANEESLLRDYVLGVGYQ